MVELAAFLVVGYLTIVFVIPLLFVVMVIFADLIFGK